jgi:hypothetical protein
MTIAEISSLISGVVSVTLAIVALWLSVVFFKMTSRLSERSMEAAKAMASSVQRLEKLFDSLYSGTFSIMKDTVSDMRRHIWPTGGSQPTSDEEQDLAKERFEELGHSLQEKLKNILRSQDVGDETFSGLNQQLGSLVEAAILESRKVREDADSQSLRGSIVSVLEKAGGIASADEIFLEVARQVTSRRLAEEMLKMRREGILTTEGAGDLSGAQVILVNHD